MRRLGTILLLVGGLLPALPAQTPGADPMNKIKELFRKAEKAMERIDDALLGADPVKAGSPEKVKAALRKARAGQEEVVKVIQEILKNLPPSSSNSGGSCNKPGEGGGAPKPKPQSKRSREKRPDIVKRKKDEKKGGGKPKGAKKKKPGGKKPEGRVPSKPKFAKNRKGKRPQADPTGGKRPPSGTEAWGNLPLFLRDVFREEQAPRLPSKYLPFWKAFLKRGRENK